MESIL
jgi:hypothetical protein